MGIDFLESVRLNLAAFLGFMRTEALALLCSCLLVVALVTCIEFLFYNRRQMRCRLFQRLREVQAKGFARGQALVPWLLRSMSMRVRSLLLVLCARSTWQRWWTWKRLFILIQASIAVLTMAACSFPFLTMKNDEAKALADAEETNSPCADEGGAQMTGIKAKFAAGCAVFVGGALMNCKAFMNIPVL